MSNPFSKTAKSAGAKRSLTLLGVCAVLALVGGIAFAAKGPTPVAAPKITSGPASPTQQTSASFTFTGGTGVTFQCSLDGSAFAACTSPKAYAGPLADGSHAFQVRARDSSGQLSSPASFSWTIDTQAPPAPQITSGPANPSSSTQATFAFADAEADVVFLCKLDAKADAACSSPATFKGLSDGLHTLSITAKDAAGNVSSATSRTWRVDTVAPPTPTITQHPSNPSPSADATFAFTDAEAGAGYECRLDSGAWASGCASPVTYHALAAGKHHFDVRALDAAGNRSAAAGFDWKVTQQTGLPFTVSGNLGGLLAPGLSGTLALTLSNPNSDPIFVTSLTVTVQPGSTKAGCDGPTNLAIVQSNASSANSLLVPAHGSASVPSGGVSAPQVQMRNLATNQDACKGATFSFAYGGSAHS